MNKLFASSLRRKILLGFIIVILIMLGITFWGIYNFYRINQSFKLTISQNYSSIIAADNMTKSVDEQLNALILSFNGDILYGRALFEKAQIDFLYWYQKARESAFTKQEKVILDSLQIDNRRFIQNVYGGFTYALKKNPKQLPSSHIGVLRTFTLYRFSK
ncbi:MAG TPA: hypothetical protein VHP30_08675, partial [Ignavibacteriales bacterium]|nr:hypothetical protein [Ignavibacteriales bacterium]